MSTNETKEQQTYAAIVNELNAHIDACTHLADKAFEEMEKMNASTEEFKEANRWLGFNYYIAGYLATIIEYAGPSLKVLENRLRFHAHAQRTKGELNDICA